MSKELHDLTAFLTLATEVLKTTQKGYREVLKYIYSDEENLVVTDGKILVTLDKTKQDIAPGFYNIAKVGKELVLIPSNFEGNYPNYTKIIPKYAFKALKINFIKTDYMWDLIKLQDATQKYCGGYVAEQYFELLKKSELIYQVFTPAHTCAEDDVHPVLFKSNNIYVVAMPRPLK